MIFAKILIIGYLILIIAIVLNVLAKKINIKTWYDFLEDPKNTNFISYLWLFILYPLLLGVSAYYLMTVI